MRPIRQDRFCTCLTAIVLAAFCCVPSFAQTNGAPAGTALGSAAFDATASVLLRSVKPPRPTVGIGPKRLDFRGVNLTKSALNMVEITNGTNSSIRIESLSSLPSGFRLSSALTLPLAIPPQTQALITVEFLPTRPGNYSGEFGVQYRTSSDGPLHKMEIRLNGKGVQQ